TGPWRDVTQAMAVAVGEEDKMLQRLGKFAAKGATASKGDKGKEQFLAHWLPMWARHHLTADHVAFAVAQACDSPIDTVELFGGITDKTLSEALAKIDDDATFARGIGMTLGYFPFPTSESLVKLVKTRLACAKDPGALLAHLPLRLRVEMTEDPAKAQ